MSIGIQQIESTTWQCISDICKPIFNYLGINYFGYGRAYKDRTMFDLSSNPLWVDHFVKEKYVGIGFDGKPFHSGIYTFYSSLGEIMPIQQFVTASQVFNMHYPLVIVNKFESYYEYFHLATHKNNSKIYDFYFNNPDIIQQITKYFKKQAAHLIESSHKNRVLLPAEFINSFDILDNNPSSPTTEKTLSFSTTFNNVNVNQNRNTKILSPRQHLCASLYIKGYSAKQIAQELNLSYRTVEYYISVIKRKLYCHTKEDLRKKLNTLEY